VRWQDHKFSCGEKKGRNRLTSIFFMSAPPTKRAMCSNKKSTLAARGLEKHVQITPIFAIMVSFMLFTVLLSLMYFFLKNF
jgi:hypothetical protein